MKTQSSLHCKQYSGFTLVELMVVIVIVAVMASMAAMGFTKFKAHGDKVASINNLRQLQTANMSYASDHHGKFVSAWTFDEEGKRLSSWESNQEFLSYFRGDVSEDASWDLKVGVPKSLLDPIAYRAKANLYDRIMASYGYNVQALDGGWNNKPGSDRTLRTGQLKKPARTCAFLTATDHYVVYGGRFTWWSKGEAVEGKAPTQKTAYRHGDKALCVFFDGHVEARSKSDMEDIDKNGGLKHPFWRGY